MDAFFAAVELLRRPELRGKPVIIGGSGDPTRRGVVATATYEARRFGVHSGMPFRTARRLCPDAVYLPTDFVEYARWSRVFKAAMTEFSPLFEDRGIDEAYLRVRAENDLVGPQIGAWANYYITPRFSMFAQPKFGIYGNSISVRSSAPCSAARAPFRAAAISPFTFSTALDTPLPPQASPPSRSSTASNSPVEAPEGTAADPTAPELGVTSAETVGLPRESRIWRA